MDPEPAIEHWGGELERAIGACPGCVVDRAVVLAETESTQDAALRAFDGHVPVAVIARRQTRGRGQRGNRWDDGDGDTLAMSIALPEEGLDPLRLAASAGLAALGAVRSVCSSEPRLLLKWPNDVIVRTPEGDRKVAGVLIEVRDGVAIIGIGINTRSRAWGGLEAVSIEELVGATDRAALACTLILELTCWMNTDTAALRDAWGASDAMVGTRRAFLINNERIEGGVIALDPLGGIRVRTGSGERELDVRVTRNA